MDEISAWRGGRRLGASLLVLGLAACAPELTGGASSGGAGQCPSEPDTPAMVAVPSAAGKIYCIDSTEVTKKQYDAWLATQPDVAMQGADCTWNETFTPQMALGADNLPVVNVDWCDAYAFCQAKGKRLCGNVETGKANDYTSYTDPNQSEWFNACSKGGTQVYPYGSTYAPTTCNGQENDPAADALMSVGSLAACQGGYPGIFDLSGNAWEWENSCDLASAPTPNKQLCRRRGGSTSNDAKNLECDTGATQTRDAMNSNIGFRCCADALP